MENYALKMQKIIEGLDFRPSIMLHSCCGPCSTSVLSTLTEFADVTVFFYNPNVAPSTEYEARLKTQLEVVRYEGFSSKVSFLEGEYDAENFLRAIAGLEHEKEGGARCAKCFYLRLKRTAETAKELGFDFFTTTLTVSPHKNASVINAIGEQIAREVGIPFLPSDFKKKDGYLTSIRLSEKMKLYRQRYCGCSFSAPRD